MPTKKPTKRTTKGKGAKRKPAKSLSPSPAVARLVGKLDDEIKDFTDKAELLYGAIQESMSIAGDRLRAGDSLRDSMNSFLICVSNRFDRKAKPDFHTGYGYDENAAQIYENIRRMGQKLSARTLVPTHGRLDAVLNELVSEAHRLAKSQSTFCESCEHCLRERFPNGDALLELEAYSTEATLDAKTWAHIVDTFGRPDELGRDELIVALRHIESLSWLGRTTGVKEAVNALVTAICTSALNLPELRDGIEEVSLENVKIDIRNNEEETE